MGRDPDDSFQWVAGQWVAGEWVAGQCGIYTVKKQP